MPDLQWFLVDCIIRELVLMPLSLGCDIHRKGDQRKNGSGFITGGCVQTVWTAYKVLSGSCDFTMLTHVLLPPGTLVSFSFCQTFPTVLLNSDILLFWSQLNLKKINLHKKSDRIQSHKSKLRTQFTNSSSITFLGIPPRTSNAGWILFFKFFI